MSSILFTVNASDLSPQAPLIQVLPLPLVGGYIAFKLITSVELRFEHKSTMLNIVKMCVVASVIYGEEIIFRFHLAYFKMETFLAYFSTTSVAAGSHTCRV